ncbi:nucleotidyltransferase domain-containing protein [Salinarchaeum laminariae]|uniref:nucleotidyltransferase domain-containing protein n=1 Tax=Salinarchaeum laminariae TaxID=869888 RepID=UPI0020BE4685|nr:nucleotidyltransferase domain-containing protein [Salinarchaeum laminariae]
MITDPNTNSKGGTSIILDIPTPDQRLFRSETVHELLHFLSRNPGRSFSISELATSIEFSRPAVTKATDTLVANDLAVEQREGTRRLVQVNRERLSVSDDPFLQIPQGAFHDPVRTATNSLTKELEGILAIVLYGSVARGEADRRSDIDLWVLVDEHRMENQRRANRIRSDLEDETFDESRYEFDVDVESLPAVTNYAAEIRRILRDGITLYKTEAFDRVQETIIHGEVDE